jgi:hypothetical protein
MPIPAGSLVSQPVGRLFYRYAWSKLVSVSKKCTVAAGITVYPNPATSGPVTISLSDASKETLPLTGLPNGTYFLITADRQSYRIVKQ